MHIFENIPPAMAFLVVILIYTDMESRDKEPNDMARYRTVNGYSPFIVEFKQPDPFYEGDDYRGGFIVYAREREDASLPVTASYRPTAWSSQRTSPMMVSPHSPSTSSPVSRES